MAAAQNNHETPGGLASGSEASRLPNYVIDPTVRTDADTCAEHLPKHLDKSVDATMASPISHSPSLPIGSHAEASPGEAYMQLSVCASSTTSSARASPDPSEPGEWHTGSGYLLPPIRINIPETHHQSSFIDNIQSRMDVSPTALTPGNYPCNNVQYEAKSLIASSISPSQSFGPRSNFARIPTIEQYLSASRQNRLHGTDQYSEPTSESTNYINRPTHRSPTDLAYILNDTPMSDAVVDKRNMSRARRHSSVSPIKRRTRGNVDPPVPLDAHTITCSFPDCGEVLVNERSTVAAHINSAHTSDGSANKNKVLCQWLNAWGEQCGTQVASNGLFRHVLDKHTSLLLTLCATCGKSFRKDSLSRHSAKCRGGVGSPRRLSAPLIHA